MKKLILIIMIMTIPIFALKIEDNTNKKEDAVKVNDNASQQDKKAKDDSNATSLDKKDTSSPNKKNTTETNGHASQLDKKEKKDKPLYTFQDKNEVYTNIITPKADESGRVFIIPGIDYNMSFVSKIDNLLIFGSDIEYLTEFMNEKLAVYGNIGIGFVEDFFLLHLGAGIKYNLPRLTRFMKPFVKLGLTLNPYFTSSSVYTPIAGTGGIGFKFFINSNIAIEQTNEFQLGTEISDSTFYMSMRFRLSAILIF